MKNIKSPLNYTGNKYRLLDQIKPYFPQKVDVFVDLFCGGATVGFNVDAQKVILIDSNERIIGLLKYLASSEYEELKKELEEIINQYSLSYSAKNTYKFYKEQIKNAGNNGLKKYNEQGFYKLRKDYNEMDDKYTAKAMQMLYILMVYGFNNDIRFNAKGEYNLPIGKTDLNKNNLNKLYDYIERAKHINYEFICGDFREEKIKKIVKNADFVYADPPYLITNAVYNEAGGWNEKAEQELIKLLEELQIKNKKFVLSNVISKENIQNEYLQNWVGGNSKLELVEMKYNYASSSYNKINRYANEKEVIIKVRE